MRRALLLVLLTLCGLGWAVNASAATFLVTNAHDSGPGSLRDAITKANLTTAADTINFAIPVGSYPGVLFHTIALQSAALPSIVAPVTINAASEPGYSGTPLIRLDNSCSCAAEGFDIKAAHTKILGFSITQFSYGILVDTGNQTTIAANWIGLAQDGTVAGNSTGVAVETTGNVIGGTTPSARNVISGNSQYGIFLLFAGKNVVSGNYIGISPDGTTATPNGNYGINVLFSDANTIGGAVAGARNVISANGAGSIHLYASQNLVEGNYLGTDATGTRALADPSDGVMIDGGAGNIVGGTAPGARNVISGYGDASISIRSSNGNVVAGNFIGTDRTGNHALKSNYGVAIINGASKNVIGGVAAAARNVISGNNVGVGITGASGNAVSGNYIGTTADGTAILANTAVGVDLDGNSNNNSIGGASPAAGNVLSGNGQYGIYLAAGSGNVMSANLIGVSKTGAPIPNGDAGILVQNTTAANTIGGAAAGARNVISANGDWGIDLYNAQQTTIQGNYIGTNISGTDAVGNGIAGIQMDHGSQNTVVGGTTPGARNVISGNTTGVYAISGDATVEGNYVGTNAAGTGAVPNTLFGVWVSGSNVVVGGTTPGARNVISGNGQHGIKLDGGSDDIEGNFIGTNAAGTSSIPNSCDGVLVSGSGTSSDAIGGNAAGARNVISGNGTVGACGGLAYGIALYNAKSVAVDGNYIGTNAAGTAALGNLNGGVVVGSTSLGVSIGGSAGNVISGNRDDGIDVIDSANETGVFHNLIGTNAAGTGPLGNVNFGIYVSASHHTDIGGTDAASGNVIAFNGATTGLDGVRVDGTNAIEILTNSIYLNGGLGIALTNGGNDGLAAPTITSVSTVAGTTTVDGTLPPVASQTYLIQIFANAKCDPSGAGEGQKYETETQSSTDGSGAGTFHVSFAGLSATTKILTATATNTDLSSLDTSPFSNCKS